MKLIQFNRKDEKLQEFKNDLILEVEMNGNIAEKEKLAEYENIEDKFSENDYVVLIDNEDNILMATYITSMNFLSPRDKKILSSFEGIFVELIYSMPDISLFDEREKEINTFLKLLSKEYPNIILYRENITGKGVNRYYKSLKSYPSIFDETEMIGFNADYSISKESTFSIVDRLNELQSNGPIKYIMTKYVDMNDINQSTEFINLIGKQLKVHNKNKYNQIEGLELATYGDVFNYSSEKKQYLLALASFENGEKVLVGLMALMNKEVKGVPYILLDYITSHKGYRRKGISKQLFAALNNHLNELNKKNKVILVSSKLSKMGTEINLNEVRKNIITDVEMYDSLSEFKKIKKIK